MKCASALVPQSEEGSLLRREKEQQLGKLCQGSDLTCNWDQQGAPGDKRACRLVNVQWKPGRHIYGTSGLLFACEMLINQQSTPPTYTQRHPGEVDLASPKVKDEAFPPHALFPAQFLVCLSSWVFHLQAQVDKAIAQVLPAISDIWAYSFIGKGKRCLFFLIWKLNRQPCEVDWNLMHDSILSLRTHWGNVNRSIIFIVGGVWSLYIMSYPDFPSVTFSCFLFLLVSDTFSLFWDQGSVESRSIVKGSHEVHGLRSYVFGD